MKLKFLDFVLIVVFTGIFSTQFPFVIQKAKAQQNNVSANNFLSNCSSSNQNHLVIEDIEKVSIGKQIFTSIFMFKDLYEDRPFLLACKIDSSNGKKTLDLEFGIPDFPIQSPMAHEIQINFYLDGQKTSSELLIPGQMRKTALDIQVAESLSIEAICQKRYACPSLNFIEASIFSADGTKLVVPDSPSVNASENRNTEETDINRNDNKNDRNTLEDIENTVNDINEFLDIFK